MKEEFCCNCHWYDGVHGCQGCAECKIKQEIVLWSDCCDHLWLIPKRLKIGLKTNADRIRAMSDEELAKSIARIAMCVDCKIKNPTCTLPISNCEKSWLEWLKQEADT